MRAGHGWVPHPSTRHLTVEYSCGISKSRLQIQDCAQRCCYKSSFRSRPFQHKRRRPHNRTLSGQALSSRRIGPSVQRSCGPRAQGFTGITPCSGGFELTPGRVTITATTAFRLIAAAYGQPNCGGPTATGRLAAVDDVHPRDYHHAHSLSVLRGRSVQALIDCTTIPFED